MKINIDKIVNKIKKKIDTQGIDYAFVLGSGLANSLEGLEEELTINYESLGMVKSAVEGHCGKFIFGKYLGKRILVFTRMHYYESGDVSIVRLPFEIVAKLGVKTIILTTAVGGINSELEMGDIVIIKDHINLTGSNPLIGKRPLEFVDVRTSYNLRLLEDLQKQCLKEGIGLKSGTHVQFSGPSYESPAEIEFLRRIGGDTVSMSTAFDIMICSALSLEQISFAFVSNKAVTAGGECVCHEDVLNAGRAACKNLSRVFNLLLSLHE